MKITLVHLHPAGEVINLTEARITGGWRFRHYSGQDLDWSFRETILVLRHVSELRVREEQGVVFRHAGIDSSPFP